jgi:hypothetical protein
LLEGDGSGGLHFKINSIALFEEKKAELSAVIQNTFEPQGRFAQQVGKAAERLDSLGEANGGLCTG